MEEQEREIAEIKEKLERMQQQLAVLSGELSRLRRFSPPVAAKRARRIRMAFEVGGVGIAATGAWWIYPPAALLLVGAWLLGDIIALRRTKRNA